MNLEEIGNFIKARRQRIGVRQEDLAQMSGVNIKTIQQIEMSTGNPSFETLSKLSEVLGLEIIVQIKANLNG